MSKKVIIAAVVIIVLVIAGWYLTRSKSSISPEISQPTPSASESPQASPSAVMTENIVTISSTGYSPKDITIKVGGSVTWTNSDSANHTVNSDPHPTHTLYPFLNLGVIKPGEKKSATFERSGKYTYHDHLNPSLTGSVTVE